MPRYIDADRLEKYCRGIDATYNDEPWMLVDILSAINDMPTVDAQPVVHGRWKYFHKQNIAVCTNCSFERNLDTNFGKAVSCPNCGAWMDGDGDV